MGGQAGVGLERGSEARFAAAWWVENGLTPHAVAMLRAIHADDPKHEPTARMIAALDRLARPIADPDLGPLRLRPGRELRDRAERARGSAPSAHPGRRRRAG